MCVVGVMEVHQHVESLVYQAYGTIPTATERPLVPQADFRDSHSSFQGLAWHPRY